MAAQKAQDPKKKEEGRQEKKQAPAPAALPVGSSDGKRRAANFTMSYREQRAQLAGCGRVAILDRDISLGQGGVLWSESRAAAPSGALVQNYVVGLGGGDIRPEHVDGLIADLRSRDEAGRPEIVEVA